MNSLITMLILGASILLEVVLELKGIKVPDVVLLLSGFAVRHIIGGDTVKDSPFVQPTITTSTLPVEQPKAS